MKAIIIIIVVVIAIIINNNIIIIVVVVIIIIVVIIIGQTKLCRGPSMELICDFKTLSPPIVHQTVFHGKAGEDRWSELSASVEEATENHFSSFSGVERSGKNDLLLLIAAINSDNLPPANRISLAEFFYQAVMCGDEDELILQSWFRYYYCYYYYYYYYSFIIIIIFIIII